jgi:hypothetical protein
MMGFNSSMGEELLCYAAVTNYSKSLRFVTIRIYVFLTFSDVIWKKRIIFSVGL